MVPGDDDGLAMTSGSRPHIVRGKVTPPALDARLVERSRLSDRLLDAVRTHRCVGVSATAGSGKTSAVMCAIERLDQDVAWLTVDRTENAPGRLVTYLEAALAMSVPAVAGAATVPMTAGVTHVEAAALLAEALPARPLLLVLDELERLDDDRGPWSVLDAFLRYAPESLRVVLVSRREIQVEPLRRPGAAIIGDRELAFTIDEAHEALDLRGQDGIDAARAVEATGGWVIGVLFEAWRIQQHVVGAGGEADALNGYLGSHILDQLDGPERAFLIATALLDEVTADRAGALGLTGAATRLATLRAANVPVVWADGNRTMRCHSRFREYLLTRLDHLEDRATQLRVRHAGLLQAEGRYEEATEEYLRAGSVDEAIVPAARAIGGVIDRLDLAIAQRWLTALADGRDHVTDEFVSAELMLALARHDVRWGCRIADRLAAEGRRDEVAGTSDRAAALMIWAYGHENRGEDVRAVIAATSSHEVAAAARGALRVISNDMDGVHDDPPAFSDGPVDGLIGVSSYALGRHSKLLELDASAWVDLQTLPFRIGALRAVGQTQRALELYESGKRSAPPNMPLDTFAAEVLMDAGRVDDARKALVAGRQMATATGAMALRGLNGLVWAKLLLRHDRDHAAARRLLDGMTQEHVQRSVMEIEIIDAWMGWADLLASDDEAAVRRLRVAVSGMQAGGRDLEIQTAAVLLAEAEWRVGEEEASDAAADVALAAATRQGSTHQMLLALADFPAVVSRRIDAQADPGSPWHDLGRVLISRRVRLSVDVPDAVLVREFGRKEFVVNTTVIQPKLTKSVEVMAFLATLPSPTATREQLLDALFDGRADDSARSYLRQAIHPLRQSLELVSGAGTISFADGVQVASESTRFLRALDEASVQQGPERLDALTSALESFDAGDYLPGARSRWASERRSALLSTATDARAQAAELAMVAGRYTEALALLDAVIEVDATREGTWRERMRIASLLGDQVGVAAAYRGCAEALTRVGRLPTQVTRRLYADLRS